MTTISVKVDTKILTKFRKIKPAYLPMSGFLSEMLNFAYEEKIKHLTNPQKNIAYIYKDNEFIKQNLEINNTKDGKGELDKRKLRQEGKEDNIKKKEEKVKNVVPEDLEKFKDYMNEFWKVKKGSKSEFSWKIQIAECRKIKDKYGDKVLIAQLEAGVLAGGWKGLSLSNYERINNLNNGTTATQNEPKGQGQNLFVPDYARDDSPFKHLHSGVN